MCDELVQDVKTGSLRKSQHLSKTYLLPQSSEPSWFPCRLQTGLEWWGTRCCTAVYGTTCTSEPHQPRPRHLPAQVQSLYLTCLSIRSPSSVCLFLLFTQSTLNTVGVLQGMELLLCGDPCVHIETSLCYHSARLFNWLFVFFNTWPLLKFTQRCKWCVTGCTDVFAELSVGQQFSDPAQH